MRIEGAWIQTFRATWESNSGVALTRTGMIKVPYIQPGPDENTWLEAIAQAHRCADRYDRLTELTYMGSRKRNQKEDN